MKIVQFVDEGLGNSAHMVISERTGQAVLVDPMRDVDRYLKAADDAGAHITHVLETHIHNDFVTGSREISARLGASRDARLQFEYDPLQDGDTIVVGDLLFQVLETPGHTPEHLSYLVCDQSMPSQPPALFSGGSLLVGAVGRTDLLGQEYAKGLALQLYSALHQKLLTLSDDVVVYPTHGAGSFCAAAPGSARSTTIGQERQTNQYLQIESEEKFIETLLRDMPSYPKYFKYLRKINQQGPPVLGRVPKLAPLTPQQVRDRMSQGEAIVDIRPVAKYLADHIPGVFHVELRPAFGVWVGWTVQFSAPIVIVSDREEEHEEAVRQLIRIGYDNLSGYLKGGMKAWRKAGLPQTQIPELTVYELASRLKDEDAPVALDVRFNHEWSAGHIPGAKHIEAGALDDGKLQLPCDKTIAVHCAQGPRSATALSLLERDGYQKLAFVSGGFDTWEKDGFPVEHEVPIR